MNDDLARERIVRPLDLYPVSRDRGIGEQRHATCHLSQAAAHEMEAKRHDQLAACNRGNIAEHLEASRRHRAAAAEEYRAAEADCCRTPGVPSPSGISM
jgi:hypothetical protein